MKPTKKQDVVQEEVQEHVCLCKKAERVPVVVAESITVTANSFHHILKCEVAVPEDCVGLVSWSFSEPIIAQKSVFTQGQVMTRVFVTGSLTAKRLNKGDVVGEIVILPL